MMDFKIRDYSPEDYIACEELVNKAWNFDDLYRPEEFSAFAKKIYTKGSVLESTYKSVAVSDGEVIGFIFGLNQYNHRRKLHFTFRVQMLWKILTVKSHSSPSKADLLKALGDHGKNRSTLVATKRSELVMFVIADDWQKKGVGSALWSGFHDDCKQAGVSKIVVETNTDGASEFYRKIGFRHLGDFYSPLHEIATPGGQACFYEFEFSHV